MTAPTRTPISREEIRAIYRQGKDAVIALVESLVARINQLEERLEAFRAVGYPYTRQPFPPGRSGNCTTCRRLS